jgi:hypothetical protein
MIFWEINRGYLHFVNVCMFLVDKTAMLPAISFVFIFPINSYMFGHVLINDRGFRLLSCFMAVAGTQIPFNKTTIYTPVQNKNDCCSLA